MQKAIVVGLGASGEACTRFLTKRDWSVIATDTRAAPPALEKLQSLEHFEFVNLDVARDRLDEVTLVVLSPGISPFFSEVAPLVKAAHIKGIDVVGEIELFARELAHLKATIGYEPKLIDHRDQWQDHDHGVDGQDVRSRRTKDVRGGQYWSQCCDRVG